MSTTLAAQEGPPQESPPDPPPSLLQQFQEDLRQLRLDQEDELSDLRFQIESLEQEMDRMRQSSATPQRLNAFNPQITVFGDLVFDGSVASRLADAKHALGS